MGSKIWCLGLLCIALFSCDRFVLKKENKEELIKEKLDNFNWNYVDEPPMFQECRIKFVEELEECFQKNITAYLHTYLSKQEINIQKSLNDTVWIPLLIDKKGTVTLENLEIPTAIATEIPNLKQLLEKSIDSLPKLAPAHTRSTPVTVRYILPLIINKN